MLNQELARDLEMEAGIAEEEDTVDEMVNQELARDLEMDRDVASDRRG